MADKAKEAVEFFKLASGAGLSDQRKREEEDLRFYRGRREDQWHSGDLLARKPDSRPCMVINLLGQPIDQIVNQARSSRLSLHFAANSDEAEAETAEIFEDLARSVQADSRAHIARNWAFERAVKCGRGYYRILTEKASDGDNDLDIVYKRILNQGSVFLDPFAQEPDYSDGRKALIVSDMRWADYKREYPESQVAQNEGTELTDEQSEAPGWMNGDGESKSVRVAEYYYVEGEGASQKVFWCKVNAIEELEKPQEQDCCYIPIVAVIGKEDYVDGERSFQGIVRPAMDAQRLFNYMVSAEAEAIALAPKAPYIMAEGQDEGHEAMWKTANTRNWPSLKYKPVALGDTMIPPPSRNVQEPAIQAISMAKAGAKDHVHSTTGVPPVAIGTLDPHERSGKAIKALQQVSEQGSSGYLDNLSAISMLYEGKILRDLIPKVYDRPGRIAHLIGADDQRRSVMLNKPFTMDGSKPVPAQAPGMMSKVAGKVKGALGMAPGGEVKHYDLKKGRYSVEVKVGKSYTTKKEQDAAVLGEVIAAVPEVFPIIGDLYVGSLEGPAMKQAADRLKKNAERQGLIQPEGQEQQQLPPQVEAQMKQAQMLIDELSKELDAKNKIIETDGIKAQQQVAIKQLDAQTKQAELASEERLKHREMEIKLEIEMAKLGSAQSMARAEIEQQDLHHHDDMQLAAAQHVEGAAQQDLDRQAEQDEAEAGRAFEGEEAERGRQHEATLTAAQLQAQKDSAKQKEASA